MHVMPDAAWVQRSCAACRSGPFVDLSWDSGVCMHLIWTILIGFLAGLVAKAITPGSGPGGFFLTAALGIAG